MLPIFAFAGIYQAISRHSGFAAFITVVKAVAVYAVLFLSAILVLKIPGVSFSIGIMQPMIFLVITGASRAIVRFRVTGKAMHFNNSMTSGKLLIYGAGLAGVESVNAIHRSAKFTLEGFIDDDVELQGRTINGMKVYSFMQAKKLIEERGITNILIAIPSATRTRRNEIIDKFRAYPVHIQLLPAVDELADGKVKISDIKEIEIEDLLGRDPVPVDQLLVQKAIAGRVVMVTGAGGSIGSELCWQLLAANPAKLLLVDNAEHNLYTIHSDLEQRRKRSGFAAKLVPLLADVTDARRIDDIIQVFAPAVIYHAAAYKHVPMVEHNPEVGVRNNVFGTLSIAEAAVRHAVSSVVLISTDKAVRPTNVMGASKRVCEMIFQGLAADPAHSTCFSMVRFGNVLGSSGSVVPLFRRQIREGGPITLTHREITRYFMTIPEASQLVIQAGAMASGGEVYLLDMGEPVKLIDLAHRMVELSGLSICDVEIMETGLRSGEKLYEELLIGSNAEATSNSRIYKANEHYIAWPELKKALDLLQTSIVSNEILNIKQYLKRIVPEYQPGSEESDFLTIEKNNRAVLNVS
ncbi:MAG: polysaccharide biosynthesis protein [Chlorobium sp.]